MSKSSIGLIGLAVMGQNLALNIARNGFGITVYNRTESKTRDFMESAGNDAGIQAAYDLKSFVASLESPRKIICMVKAGAPVDALIEQIAPLLEPGDLLIDGGNSLYKDTERRGPALRERGLRYMGAGISGGEEGALNGPSIMPGGEPEDWEMIRPVFEAIAAKAEGKPCVAYMGKGGAGHFVKMVHNGIEYGDMQLIAESYDFMRLVVGLKPGNIGRVFKEWSKDKLESYLVDITADVFAKIDSESGDPLVERILDKAGQKGTGRWTVESALELGVPTPTLSAAVEARILSSLKDERVRAAEILEHEENTEHLDSSWTQFLGEALYAAKICSYAQGFALLRAADAEYGFGLDYAAIARIWRAGCIIRAKFLNDVSAAYEAEPALPNLMLAPFFRAAMGRHQSALRRIVAVASARCVPFLAFSASLAYFDSYRSPRLPANLIQAQRDYFGAHTYERTDKPGIFHTEWTE